MSAVRERLEAAREYAGLSVRALHLEMQEREVPGSSYPNVHRYLKGELEPSLGFLREAADVMHVRPKWLIADAGEMTEEAERARLVEARAARGDIEDPPEFIVQDIRSGFDPDTPPTETEWWLSGRPVAVAELVAATRRKQRAYRMATGFGDDAPAEEADSIAAEMAIRVGEALRATLDALDVDPESMDHDAREDFIRGMATAIIATVNAAPRGAQVIGIAHVADQED